MTKIHVDKWDKFYASRVQTLRPSAIRDLMSVSSRPDIISLAGGFPHTRDFPFDKLKEIINHVIKNSGPASLQYGPTEGFEELKRHIKNIMAEENTKAKIENILITTGATQALDLVTKTFVDPGDALILEAPSYSGAITTFVSYQAEIVQIPIDDDGLITDKLQTRIEEIRESGKSIKFLYTIPNFHNPAGVTMSSKRRTDLIRIANEQDLMIIEDNPYGLLRFEGKKLPTLKSMDTQNRVLYLGTLSKILSAGMRLGWVVAPTAILAKLIFGKQATDLCSNSFTQYIALEYFKHGIWKEYVSSVIKIYRERCATMQEALKEFFPEESTWTKPKGGFFLWATVPPYLDTTEMLAESIREEKVAFIPGQGFFAEKGGVNAMRLAFSYCDSEQIYEGIKRIGKVIKRQSELYRSLQI